MKLAGSESVKILVEVLYNSQKYFIPEDDLRNADTLQMDDGTLLDLRKTGIEYRDNRRVLIVATDGGGVSYRLPILQVIRVPQGLVQ